MNAKDAKVCPSYRCEEGAILLGIVQADGKVSLAADPIVIDQGFVDKATQGRSPDRRFRFAGQCAQGGCQHWESNRCGVIDKVLSIIAPVEPIPEIPPCSIRPICRWYSQEGARACAACPDVLTYRLLPKAITQHPEAKNG